MRTVSVELGDRVKDPITGFQGIVIVRMIWLHGCIRVAVQPEKLSDDGLPPEDRAFDDARVEIVKKGVIKPTIIAVPNQDAARLGDRVKDKITGFEGIVVATSEWLIGTTRLGVQPEKIKKGTNLPTEEQWFDESRLAVVKRGVHKVLETTVVPASPPPARVGNGGPARESRSFKPSSAR